MKRILLSLFLVLLTFSMFAQTPPQSFKYQSVVRDMGGEILDDQDVYFRISILQYTDTGDDVYIETFDRATNDFGIVAFNIGDGDAVVEGIFADIDWSDGPYFVKVEIDIDGIGGTYTYEEAGTSELLSVPYALHAKTAENATEADPQVGTNTMNYLPKWDGTSLVTSTIFDNGKIGIGTSSPTEALHIKPATPDGNIRLEMADGDGYYIGYNGGGDYMAISTINGGSSFMETMNLKSGKVGIGTTNPTAKLDVEGTIHASGTASNGTGTFTFVESTDSHEGVHENLLNLQNNSGIATSQANILFSAGNPAHGRAIISATHDIPAGGTYDGNMYFKVRSGAGTNNSINYNTALTLRSTGFVGINETDPDAELHVNGDAHITGNLDVGGIINGTVPVGGVVAWLKSLPNTPSLPVNFVECNGQILDDSDSPYNGATIPNLNASMFLKGQSASGTTGGSETHSHTLSINAASATTSAGTFGTLKSVGAPIHSHSGTVNSADSNPPYYTVVWIIRIK